MQISIAAAGNADTNVNLIDHRFMAEALRQIRGIDCGVLDNSFYSSADATGLSRTNNSSFKWKLTASNVQNITVGRGMATAYGIDAKSESDVSFTATAPSSGTKYLFIYLQWDLSNPVEGKGDLLLHDNGSSATWTPPYQDNLITNPIGKYQMPLYRLTVNTSGTVTATANWTSLGVLTVSYPLRAQHANHAEQADFAMYASNNQSDGTIDGRLIAIVNRLNALGFKQVSIESANSSYIDTANTKLYMLGKVLYGYIALKSTGWSTAAGGNEYPQEMNVDVGYIYMGTPSGTNGNYSCQAVFWDGTGNKARPKVSIWQDGHNRSYIHFNWWTEYGSYSGTTGKAFLIWDFYSNQIIL